MTNEQLKTAFFQIFNIEADLDMEDIQVMWEALMIKNNIQEPAKWDEFVSDINCMASAKWEFFSKIFDLYFETEFIF